MRKNAEIKDIREAMVRMIKGEVFWFNGLSMSFAIDEMHLGESAFAARESDFPDDKMLISDEWLYVKNWEVSTTWEETLGDGVLCKAWRHGEGRIISACPVKIVSYSARTREYWDETGVKWDRAEPVSLAEIEKYIIK